MRYDPRQLNQPRSSGRGRRIPEELMIAKVMPRGQAPKAMYDLGVGVFSEFRTLKKVWPGMALFGCEPCPAEFAELVPIFDGKLISVGIGAKNERRTIWLSEKGQGGSTLLPNSDKVSGPTIDIDVWTLDRFDEWAGKPEKILLWADVEGAEMEVLVGGQELLRSGRVHWINLETRDVEERPDHFTTDQLDDHLKDYGYAKALRYNVQGGYPEAPGDVIWFKKGIPRPVL